MWYQHWWAMSTILSRPEYHVWQEWKWNQALGIYRGSPFQGFAVVESARSGSVAVVSGIYNSDHWWLQAYL